MIDQHGRNITYLRISITDRCNLKCFYCHPDGITTKLPKRFILTYEEILRLIRIFERLGIRKVRITGGEPFARKGCIDFIEEVCRIPGIEEVCITTNGKTAGPYLSHLKTAGVTGLNISLDTLDPVKYQRITGVDGFYEVWETLMEAVTLKFKLLKVNTVLLRHINDDEIEDIARLVLSYPISVRFIELMPIGFDQSKYQTPLLEPEIKKILSRSYDLVRILDKPSDSDGPARYYSLKGGKGKIGFISPVSSHFCSSCNRIRLTADGRIRPCLLDSSQYDIREAMRKGADDHELERIIHKIIFNKNKNKNFKSISHSHTRQMQGIGG